MAAVLGESLRLMTIGWEYIHRGGKDGKVTIDRSALDEILAEIAQIKAILRRNGG